MIGHGTIPAARASRRASLRSAAYADVFQKNVLASGVVPQISVIMGALARAAAVYSPAITDFIYMVRDTSYMFVTGPDVVKTVTNEVVTAEELGGARTHTTKSSVADGAYDNDVETLRQMRRLFDFLPLNNRQAPPTRPFFDAPDREEPSLDTVVPADANRPYDMHEVIAKIADEGDFFEVQEAYAKNIIIGFMRLEGRTDRLGGEPAVGARGGCSTSPRRARQPASCASATRSTCRS